ncbi:MAG TPA: CpsD/CapB family tyrosine-protein kinase [Acidimicrobiia bacterium]|nr:CpsD/CapB family tyrosine-protein kinase [Acidimicrobiia bacterium]
MRPVEYLRLVRQRWWVLPITAIIGLIAAFATKPAAPKPIVVPPSTYKATAVLVAKPLGSSETPGIDYDRLALLATTGDVPQRVSATLGVGNPTAFTPPPVSKDQPIDPNVEGNPRGVFMSPATVVVTPNKITGSLTIVASGNSRYQAAAVANAMATELQIFLNLPSSNGIATPLVHFVQSVFATVDAQRKPIFQQIPTLHFEALAAFFARNINEAKRLNAQHDAAVNRLISLDRQLFGYLQTNSTSPLVTYQLASTNSEDVIPPKLPKEAVVKAGLPRYLLGMGIGIAVGIAIILLAETMRPRVRDLRSAEGTARMPVAAEISAVPITRADRFRVIAAEEPSSLLAEAYRTLRTSIIAMWPRHPVNTNGSSNGSQGHAVRPLRTLLVTSAGPGEGKSVTAVNLAATFAETGARVIVLDADPRRPTIHRYFGGRSTPNLAELDTDLTAEDLEHVLQDSTVPGVRFAASARGNMPAQTVGVVKAATRVATELADVVILDCPPILVANDAADLATVVDATIFVVRANRTRRETVARAAGLLRRVEARVIGAVLVGVERTTPDGFYGYYGYYGYEDESARPRKRFLGGRRKRARARQRDGQPARAVEAAGTRTEGSPHPVAVIDLTDAPTHHEHGARSGTIVREPATPPSTSAPRSDEPPDGDGPDGGAGPGTAPPTP